MMRRLRFIAAVLAAIGLAGCAGSPPPRSATSTEPTVLDLAPSGFGSPVAMDQAVTGSFQGQSRSMRVRIEIAPGALHMIGLDYLGLPLFTLRHDGRTLEAAAASGEDLPFDPRYILADFQLAFWPAEELGKALRERGLKLEIVPTGGRRLLDASGILLAETSRPPTDATGQPVPEMVVTRHVPPYRLLIRTKRVEARR